MPAGGMLFSMGIRFTIHFSLTGAKPFPGSRREPNATSRRLNGGSVVPRFGRAGSCILVPRTKRSNAAEATTSPSVVPSAPAGRHAINPELPGQPHHKAHGTACYCCFLWRSIYRPPPCSLAEFFRLQAGCTGENQSGGTKGSFCRSSLEEVCPLLPCYTKRGQESLAVKQADIQNVLLI